jgi:hypothetical protein
VPKIDLVYGDDWIGLYLDGKLVEEGHSLEPFHVLDALGIKHTYHAADIDWLHEEGCLPERLDDVKREN